MTAPPAAVPGTSQTREQAGRIVEELAARLAEPDRVAAIAADPGNAEYVPAVMPAPEPPWSGLTLSEGHAGVSLLYAELAALYPGCRKAAHAHLAAAARHLPGAGGSGLYGGAAAMAFAARVAQSHPDDYQDLLGSLDEHVTARVRSLLDRETARLRAGEPGVRMADYDTIGGATGLGRYLLLRQPRHQELLAGTLTYLTELTRPVTAHGHVVPGWWADQAPGLVAEPRFARGHFNLGLAHGIAGPLALLALARLAGIQVPGHDEAITRIVGQLMPFQARTGLWPGRVSFDEYVAQTPDQGPGDQMIAWCYGTPGTARAIYLAGAALRQPGWQQAGVRALRDAFARQPPGRTDCSLCHGWAGLLHITSQMARDSGDQALAARLPALAAPIIDAYDPAHPFGFRYTRSGLPPGYQLAPHRAGFLEGAAGIALALHAYATGHQPRSDWAAALLIT